MALMATVELFDRDDLAGKVMPNMAFTLVDREKYAHRLFGARADRKIGSRPSFQSHEYVHETD